MTKTKSNRIEPPGEGEGVADASKTPLKRVKKSSRKDGYYYSPAVKGKKKQILASNQAKVKTAAEVVRKAAKATDKKVILKPIGRLRQKRHAARAARETMEARQETVKVNSRDDKEELALSKKKAQLAAQAAAARAAALVGSRIKEQLNLRERSPEADRKTTSELLKLREHTEDSVTVEADGSGTTITSSTSSAVKSSAATSGAKETSRAKSSGATCGAKDSSRVKSSGAASGAKDKAALPQKSGRKRNRCKAEGNYSDEKAAKKSKVVCDDPDPEEEFLKYTVAPPPPAGAAATPDHPAQQKKTVKQEEFEEDCFENVQSQRTKKSTSAKISEWSKGNVGGKKYEKGQLDTAKLQAAQEKINAADQKLDNQDTSKGDVYSIAETGESVPDVVEEDVGDESVPEHMELESNESIHTLPSDFDFDDEFLSGDDGGEVDLLEKSGGQESGVECMDAESVEEESAGDGSEVYGGEEQECGGAGSDGSGDKKSCGEACGDEKSAGECGEESCAEAGGADSNTESLPTPEMQAAGDRIRREIDGVAQNLGKTRIMLDELFGDGANSTEDRPIVIGSSSEENGEADDSNTSDGSDMPVFVNIKKEKVDPVATSVQQAGPNSVQECESTSPDMSSEWTEMMEQPEFPNYEIEEVEDIDNEAEIGTETANDQSTKDAVSRQTGKGIEDKKRDEGVVVKSCLLIGTRDRIENSKIQSPADKIQRSLNFSVPTSGNSETAHVVTEPLDVKAEVAFLDNEDIDGVSGGVTPSVIPLLPPLEVVSLVIADAERTAKKLPPVSCLLPSTKAVSLILPSVAALLPGQNFVSGKKFITPGATKMSPILPPPKKTASNAAGTKVLPPLTKVLPPSNAAGTKVLPPLAKVLPKPSNKFITPRALELPQQHIGKESFKIKSEPVDPIVEKKSTSKSSEKEEKMCTSTPNKDKKQPTGHTPLKTPVTNKRSVIKRSRGKLSLTKDDNMDNRKVGVNNLHDIVKKEEKKERKCTVTGTGREEGSSSREEASSQQPRTVQAGTTSQRSTTLEKTTTTKSQKRPYSAEGVSSHGKRWQEPLKSEEAGTSRQSGSSHKGGYSKETVTSQKAHSQQQSGTRQEEETEKASGLSEGASCNRTDTFLMLKDDSLWVTKKYRPKAGNYHGHAAPLDPSVKDVRVHHKVVVDFFRAKSGIVLRASGIGIFAMSAERLTVTAKKAGIHDPDDLASLLGFKVTNDRILHSWCRTIKKNRFEVAEKARLKQIEIDNERLKSEVIKLKADPPALPEYEEAADCRDTKDSTLKPQEREGKDEGPGLVAVVGDVGPDPAQNKGGEAEKEVEELEQADEINNDDELDSEDDQPSYDELRESLEKKRQMNRTLANIVNKQRMTYKENYEALEKQNADLRGELFVCKTLEDKKVADIAKQLEHYKDENLTLIEALDTEVRDKNDAIQERDIQFDKLSSLIKRLQRHSERSLDLIAEAGMTEQTDAGPGTAARGDRKRDRPAETERSHNSAGSKKKRRQPGRKAAADSSNNLTRVCKRERDFDEVNPKYRPSEEDETSDD